LQLACQSLVLPACKCAVFAPCLTAALLCVISMHMRILLPTLYQTCNLSCHITCYMKYLAGAHSGEA
jgi:hypothetical protein